MACRRLDRPNSARRRHGAKEGGAGELAMHWGSDLGKLGSGNLTEAGDPWRHKWWKGEVQWWCVQVVVDGELRVIEEPQATTVLVDAVGWSEVDGQSGSTASSSRGSWWRGKAFDRGHWLAARFEGG
jgi:hypothetical protein